MKEEAHSIQDRVGFFVEAVVAGSHRRNHREVGPQEAAASARPPYHEDDGERCRGGLRGSSRKSATGGMNMIQQPTPAQIDLIRNLVRSVTPENAHTEYEKASLQFTSKEEFQAALRFVKHEIQQHLTLIEHWHHLSTVS
jgi:hypothetical protein